MKSVVPLLALPLAACVSHEDPHPVPLASLSGLHLSIWASADEVQVDLKYDDAVSGCGSLLSSFDATVAGTAGPVETAGGKDEGLCTYPVLRLASPPAIAPAQLVLHDESLTITADLDDALLPRSAHVVPATIAQDQSITLDWSPAADLAKYKPEVWLLEADRAWSFDSTISNTQLQFTVLPQLPLVAGNAKLQIKMTQAVVPPVSCSNATCELTTNKSSSDPIVVVQP